MAPDSLKKILEQQGAGLQPLPPVRDTPSALQRLVDEMAQWLSQCFRSFSISQADLNPRLLLYALLIALVAAGLLAIVAAYFQRRAALAPDASSALPATIPTALKYRLAPPPSIELEKAG